MLTPDVHGTSCALSPSQLMHGKKITACQNGKNYEFTSTHESLTKRVRHHNGNTKYLTSLRENVKITKENEPLIAIGDIVLLKKVRRHVFTTSSSPVKMIK